MEQIEGLLIKHGFKQSNEIWEYKKYKKKTIPHGKTIMAHFGTDKKLAANFTLEIYEKVFNLSLTNMELKVG